VGNTNDWAREPDPVAAGFDPARLDAAIAYHLAHETEWPRSMYLPGGQYVGTASIGDRPEFAAVIGPVRPRGAPNGLILRHGRLVAEWGDTANADMTFSVAKSYLALLAGFALEDGLIADLDAPVAGEVPGEWFASAHNAAITWRHLLTQTSEWQGTLWGKPDLADHNRSTGAKGTAVKGEARTLAAPGSFFEYNDVRVNLLAACLTQRFGRPLPDVLRERVMDPIGASSDWEWHGYEGATLNVDGRALRCVSGGGHWGGGQFIGSRDHARMGQLVLQGGVWEGRRIVPEAWVRTMMEPSRCNDQYGLLWWLNSGAQKLFPSAPRDSVFALGAGRSLVWIAPALDMVTVLRWIDRDSTDGMFGAIMQAL
jgi:CubicO group peptidase (beta-lactamase class C family)